MTAKDEAKWIPAAVSADIPEGTVIPATHPNGPIAIWRSASGRINANGDRCPHRGMRLSQGFVRGETLSCIYHGWRYGRDGACEYIPAHPRVTPPAAINCGPLAAREQDGVVWVADRGVETSPAAFPGFDALRSLVVSAPPAALRAASGGAAGGAAGGETVRLELGGTEAILILAPRAEDETFVIALIGESATPADRVAASTALEALRRAAEAQG